MLYFCIYVFLWTLVLCFASCLSFCGLSELDFHELASWSGSLYFIYRLQLSWIYACSLLLIQHTWGFPTYGEKKKHAYILSYLVQNTKKQPTVCAGVFFCFSVLMTQWLLGQLLRFQVFRKASLHILCFGNDPLLTHKLFSAYIWNANTGHPGPSLVW